MFVDVVGLVTGCLDLRIVTTRGLFVEGCSVVVGGWLASLLVLPIFKLNQSFNLAPDPPKTLGVSEGSCGGWPALTGTPIVTTLGEATSTCTSAPLIPETALLKTLVIKRERFELSAVAKRKNFKIGYGF